LSGCKDSYWTEGQRAEHPQDPSSGDIILRRLLVRAAWTRYGYMRFSGTAHDFRNLRDLTEASGPCDRRVEVTAFDVRESQDEHSANPQNTEAV
jgi:hypothetical protein